MATTYIVVLEISSRDIIALEGDLINLSLKHPALRIQWGPREVNIIPPNVIKEIKDGNASP